MKKYNTKFEYMYTDANNYKTSEIMVLKGELIKNKIERIFSKCDQSIGDNAFIPQQVELPNLQPRLQKYDSKDWGDDHCWHEIVSIELTEEKVNFDKSASDIYDAFNNVVEWDDSIKIGHILKRNTSVYFKDKQPEAEYSKWGNRSYEKKPLEPGWYDVVNISSFGIVTLAVNLSCDRSKTKDKPLKFQPSIKHLYRIQKADLKLASDKIEWK